MQGLWICFGLLIFAATGLVCVFYYKRKSLAQRLTITPSISPIIRFQANHIHTQSSTPSQSYGRRAYSNQNTQIISPQSVAPPSIRQIENQDLNYDDQLPPSYNDVIKN